MADLSVDYDELEKARTNIDASASAFANANSVSEDIAGLVGHSGLASRVNDFADSWDISRDKLRESLTFVSESITAIIDTFKEVDEAQAKALSDPAPKGP